jgi:hypothetical protein
MPLKRSLIVAREFNKHKQEGVKAWGNIAVSVMLTKGADPVLFVPLSCGATCNCQWLIVDSSGKRSYGVVNACVIEVEVSPRKWPRLLCYGHMGAEDGILSVYTFTNGHYAKEYSVTLVGAAASPWQDCADNEKCCP